MSNTEQTTETNIGLLNPFRYRSYYYDRETKLYYLQSRYYDPKIGRFLNSDSLKVAIRYGATEPNGVNLYSYCSNDPVNYKDSNGYFKIAAHERRDSYGYGFNGLNLGGWAWIGFSSYTTQVDGGDGFFYSYSSNKIDLGNITGLELPVVGGGLNFWNKVSVEVGIKPVGLEASIPILNISVGISRNIIGGTSFSFGHSVKNADGTTTTKEFTFGINTLVAGLMAISLISLFSTGSPAPIPSPAPSSIFESIVHMGNKVINGILNFFKRLF